MPNAESALNEEAGKLLLERYDDYSERAKMMTEIHAQVYIYIYVCRCICIYMYVLYIYIIMIIYVCQVEFYIHNDRKQIYDLGRWKR